MAAPFASSSGWSYDVFLNFRGADTRRTFTGHLYNALVAAGIHTFKDDEELRTGEEIGPELLSVIQQSRISIPIFSKNYASSKWCLYELVKIVECRKTMNQHVLPIFYDVDPSDVRNHTGSYEAAIHEHNNLFHQKVIDEWKEALKEIGELKGWNLKNIANGDEATLTNLVAAEVLHILRKDCQFISDDLVGIQPHVDEMMSLLNLKSEDVKIVGVWGLGGIGKTTIAKVVYDAISHNFDGCSFLADIRETSQCYGLVYLQNQLLSNILEGKRHTIYNIDNGKKVIRDKLCRKRVLIILDDVDENNQLDALVGKHNWFGLGSRIIITTRNGHILVNAEVNEIYEPREMDANHSLQLFSRHAFRRDQIPADFQDLSKDIVKITGGLPLALEVIGSYLFRIKKSAWHDTLKMLQEIPNDEVQKKLRISFDGLTYLEKEIFLDVACFFIGMDRDIACFMWSQCKFYPEIGIEVLCQKSLIKIGENNELMMHDQLRDLGREIIRQENFKVPGERSRLWSHKVAADVLDKCTGTDKVEGLSVNFKGSPRSQSCLTSSGFSKMTKLRLLQVDYAHFAPDFLPSFSELVWLSWKGCADLEFTLTRFDPVNLVVLDLSYSDVAFSWKGWHYLKVAKFLKVLNLTGCHCLSKTPSLANRRLEVLILQNCKSLAEIDESIDYLEMLVTLDMRGCSKLRDLPYGIGGLTYLKNLNLHLCEGFEKLPDSIGLLENLKTFDASFCYIKDEGITDAIGWLSSLEILKLGGNDFHFLPVTLSSLNMLQTLDLRFCSKLESLPELPSSLKYLNVLRCISLKSLPVLSKLIKLEVLCLDDCVNLVKIPALLGSRNLKRLNLDNFPILEEVEGLEDLDSLEHLTIKNCGSLRKIGRLSKLRKLKRLNLDNFPSLQEFEGLADLDSLKHLTISNCRLLRKIGRLSNLRKLEELVLCYCEKLNKIESLGELDSLELLMLNGCDLKILKLVELKKLKRLNLANLSNLEEVEGLEDLDSLEHLTIRHCGLLRLGRLSNLRKLEVLDLRDCEKLVEIESLGGLDSLELLTFVGLYKIPKLVELKKLRVLDVWYCSWLDEIEGLVGLDSLERLTIHHCNSLRKIPDLCDLKKLRVLDVGNCGMLSQIDGLVGLDSLEWLVIYYCSSLIEIPDSSGLKRLRVFEVGWCENLLKIEGLVGLDSLQLLTIHNCKSLIEIPCLCGLRKLSVLEVVNCQKLSEIEGLVGLDSLEQLTVFGCTSLTRVSNLFELQKLRILEVGICSELLEIKGIAGLDSLEQLTVLTNFNVDKSLIKASDLSKLKKLGVVNVWSLEDFTKGVISFKDLDSLERLAINSCESFTQVSQLTNYKGLGEADVQNCEKSLKIEIEGLKLDSERLPAGSTPRLEAFETCGRFTLRSPRLRDMIYQSVHSSRISS